MCALTDKEQHADNSLSTSSRTAQPLSPEADPFVQGETRGDGSKGHRNDLEWQSRELAKQEADFEAEVCEGSILEPDSKQILWGGHVAEFGLLPFSSPGNSFPGRLNPSPIHFALNLRSKTENLIFLMAK